MPTSPDPTCPIPITPDDVIVLAHGGGGSLTQRLLNRVILPRFPHPALRAAHDGAVLALAPATGGARIAFTTDAYVVRPIEFPGGDIGSLAVNGTVNDLAMCGARPAWLSASLILEEGLSQATLGRVLDSMAAAARTAGIELVTGDTKVVERGHGDGLYIATAGIGTVVATSPVEPRSVRPGDAILVSGDLGRHGFAILGARENLGFEPPIASDCAPLAEPVLDLLAAGRPVHCLRDLTRGGLAATLHEIAAASGLGMEIDERLVPVSDPVRAAAELLGIDPLHVANEGRFAAFVPAEHADALLEVLRRHPVTAGAVRVGQVTERGAAPVVLLSRIGARRILPLLSGEQLPRIC
jgi:hydrogenase expression/formation protein HypE